MKLLNMKQDLFRKLLGTVGTLMCFTIIAPAFADPPGYTICAGLTGVAYGLCNGGVASGCADGTGDPIRCEDLAARYLKLTGTELPWIAPPITCPCDFNLLVDKMSPYWTTTPGSSLEFVCSDLQAWLVTAVGDLDPKTMVYVDTSSQIGQICGALENDIVLDQKSFLTVEENEACIQGVLDYAQEFIALNPDVPVDDMCTPTLSP